MNTIHATREDVSTLIEQHPEVGSLLTIVMQSRILKEQEMVIVQLNDMCESFLAGPEPEGGDDPSSD